MVVIAFGLLLTGCGQAAEDYRVIEREYVPASEVPGVADIDLEQVSYPVLVGSVAIAEQFPDMVWPDMVNEERWRLGLPPDLQAELLYPRECLFVSPAPNGIGTVRRIIDGEMIFFRIHRAAGIDPGQCGPKAGGTPDNFCYRITALSESSGMCKDNIKVSRVASFEVIEEEEGARIFYAHQDAIFVRSISIQNGCPVFSDESKSLIGVGNFTQHIRAHESEKGSVYIAWVDKAERAQSQGLKFIQYQGREITSQGLVSRYVPSGRSLGYIEFGKELYLHWASSLFSTQFLFKADNPSKLMLIAVSEGEELSSELVVLNKPNDPADNALAPIVLSAAHFGINVFWRSGTSGNSSDNVIQSGLMNRELTRVRISDSPISSREFERRLLGRMTDYHRRLGRGPDGPLPPLECTRGAVDPQGESTPAVLVPGRGLKTIGRGDVDPESGEGGGG